MLQVKQKTVLFSLGISLLLTAVLMFLLRLLSLDTGPMVNVVVATTKIPGKTIIKDVQIKEVKVPKKYFVESAITNKDQAIGKVAREDILAGEQIVFQRLAYSQERDGLSVVIPEGWRAVTIKVDPVSGVGNHIKRGDLVDILVFLKPPYASQETVLAIFQKIEILDTGKDSTLQTDEKYLTLCMKLKDAEKLFLATEVGKIHLVLRPIIDTKVLNIPSVNILSIK